MTTQTKYTIEHSPSYASLRLDLKQDETVFVESGAMAAMDSCIKMKSKVQGGLMKGIGRILGGESLFVSEFTAVGKPGQLFVSPGVPGDIQHYCLNGNSLILQASGFVASSPSVTMDTKFKGLQSFFSSGSMFLIKASGSGDFWFSSYGAIVEIPVDGNYVVDTGYIVAFEDTLNYNVETIGGLSFNNPRTGVLGGEGFVCRFQGKGRLWIQSRNIFPLLNFLALFRPTKSD